jgi:hypothetical protein
MIKLLQLILENTLYEYSEEEKRKLGIPSGATARGGNWYSGDTYVGKVVNGKFVPATKTQPNVTPVAKSTNKANINKLKAKTKNKSSSVEAKPKPKPKEKTVTSQFIEDLSNQIAASLSKGAPAVANIVSQALGRNSPAKFVKPGVFEKLRSGVMKTQGKEVLGSYNPEKDVIILYNDEAINSIFKTSAKNWNEDQAEQFNVLVHETVHSTSPRLKDVNSMTSIELALEEGITEFVSLSVTKNVQLSQGRNSAIVPDGPYNDFVNVFATLALTGTDVKKVFTSTSSPKELSEFVANEGETTIKTAFSKVFSDAEVDKITKTISDSVLDTSDAKLGHALLSPNISFVIRTLLNTEYTTLNNSKKIKILGLMGMDEKEISQVLDDKV